MGSQSDDDGSRVGEGDLPNHGGPAKERRTLQVKEEKYPAKEAFNATAFAQFLLGPRRRQTGTVLLSLGIPGNDRNSAQSCMNPGDEA